MTVLDRATDWIFYAIALAVPGALGWLLGGVWAGAACVCGLFSIGMIAKGLSWDPSGLRPRCPKCWYSMPGATPGATCPECGRIVRDRDELFKTRPNRKLMWAGVGVVALFAATFTAVEARTGRLWDRWPSWLVVRLLPYAGDTAWTRVNDRYPADGEPLWGWSRGALQSACVDVLRSSRSGARRIAAFGLRLRLYGEERLPLYHAMLESGDTRLRYDMLMEVAMLSGLERATFVPELRRQLESGSLQGREAEVAERIMSGLP